MQEVDGIEPSQLLMGKKRQIITVCESIVEDNYLEPIYGLLSRLSYDEWCTRSCEKPEIRQVFYDPERLRSLAFTKAEIEFAGKENFVKWC